VTTGFGQIQKYRETACGLGNHTTEGPRGSLFLRDKHILP